MPPVQFLPTFSLVPHLERSRPHWPLDLPWGSNGIQALASVLSSIDIAALLGSWHSMAMATAWFMAPADSGSANFPCSRLQFLLSSCVCLWYLYVSVTGSWMNLGRTATFLAGLGSFQVSYSYGTDFHGFSMFFFFFCI